MWLSKLDSIFINFRPSRAFRSLYSCNSWNHRILIKQPACGSTNRNRLRPYIPSISLRISNRPNHRMAPQKPPINQTITTHKTSSKLHRKQHINRIITLRYGINLGILSYFHVRSTLPTRINLVTLFNNIDQLDYSSSCDGSKYGNGSRGIDYCSY